MSERPSALGRLVATTAPVVPAPDAPAVCGKPTMAQDSRGEWIPCHREPDHDGGCR